MRQYFSNSEALDILDEIEQKTNVQIRMSKTFKNDLNSNDQKFLRERAEDEIMRSEEFERIKASPDHIKDII